MLHVTHRTSLGRHYNEGARKLWAVMVRRGHDQTTVCKLIRCSKGAMSKWLFGEQRPSALMRGRIFDSLGISMRVWDEPPKGPSRLPSVAA